jgi:hypothetical protein
VSRPGDRAARAVAPTPGRISRSAQAGLLRAHRPRLPALRLEDPLGDLDLLGLAGLVRRAVPAVLLPGAGRELQSAVVAVAGGGVPLAAALALRDAVPLGGGRRGVGGAGERDGGAQRDGGGDGGLQQAAALGLAGGDWRFYELLLVQGPGARISALGDPDEKNTNGAASITTR